MKKFLKITLYVVLLLTILVVSLEVFSSYTPSKTIHENAPVKTTRVISINAPVGVVYQVFTDVNNWPAWQKEISSAKIDGPLQPGAGIDWKTGGLTIHSVLQTVDANKKIGWAGKAFGSYAVHVWTFEQKGDYTMVTVQESMEGWVVSLLSSYFQSHLEPATEFWLNALKVQVEKH